MCRYITNGSAKTHMVQPKWNCKGAQHKRDCKDVLYNTNGIAKTNQYNNTNGIVKAYNSNGMAKTYCTAQMGLQIHPIRIAEENTSGSFSVDELRQSKQNNKQQQLQQQQQNDAPAAQRKKGAHYSTLPSG